MFFGRCREGEAKQVFNIRKAQRENAVVTVAQVLTERKVFAGGEGERGCLFKAEELREQGKELFGCEGGAPFGVKKGMLVFFELDFESSHALL